MKVHVFSYEFKSEAEAMKYATAMDYDDDDSIPELWENIGADFLDEDFIETVFGEDKFKYLMTLVEKHEDVQNMQAKCPSTHNALFLIFGVKGSFNESYTPKNTVKPLYIGSANAKFHKNT